MSQNTPGPGVKMDPSASGPDGREKTNTSLGSVDLPHVSGMPGVDFGELSHARKGMEPTPDPLTGQSLVDTEGNMKHISPHGVIIDQYFPDVDPDARGRVRSMGGFEPRAQTMESISETETQSCMTSDSNPRPRAAGKEETMDSVLLGTESTTIDMGSVSREVTGTEQQGQVEIAGSIEWTETGQRDLETITDEQKETKEKGVVSIFIRQLYSQILEAKLT